ncbi:MAG TPA: hypothetical protein VGP55_11085 [Chitinophagaceae bacterium]|nr:hypothetical protein [Chitinophagaceae bacterium]
MKTKTFIVPILTAVLIMAFISCKKSNTTKQGDNLNGTWTTNNWGGVNANICTWTVSANGTTGTITQLGSQTSNFSVGDQLYTNIKVSGTGTYNATGKYTYGVNNAQSGTRPCTLTLSNNNTTLTANYPPITSGVNAGFGEIIYVFQK